MKGVALLRRACAVAGHSGSRLQQSAALTGGVGSYLSAFLLIHAASAHGLTSGQSSPTWKVPTTQAADLLVRGALQEQVHEIEVVAEKEGQLFAWIARNDEASGEDFIECKDSDGSVRRDVSSGGPRTPFVQRACASGERVQLRVGSTGGIPRTADLVVVWSNETDATSTASTNLRTAVLQAKDLLRLGRGAEVRVALTASLSDLFELEGATDSWACYEVLQSLAGDPELLTFLPLIELRQAMLRFESRCMPELSDARLSSLAILAEAMRREGRLREAIQMLAHNFEPSCALASSSSGARLLITNLLTALYEVEDWEQFDQGVVQGRAAALGDSSDMQLWRLHLDLLWGVAAGDRGRVEDCISVCERVLREYSVRLEPDATDRIQAQAWYAQFLSRLGDHDRALTLAQGAWHAVKDLPPTSATRATALEALSAVHWERGSYTASVALKEQLLDFTRASRGENSLEVDMQLCALASTLRNAGDRQAALAIELELLPRLEARAELPRVVLAEAWLNHATTLSHLGHSDRAYELFERALWVLEDELEESSALLQNARVSLAVELKHQGDSAAARELEEQVLSAIESGKFRGDPDFECQARMNHGITLRQSDPVTSARNLSAALELQKLVLDPSHEFLQIARFELMRSLSLAAELERIPELYQAVLGGIEARLGQVFLRLSPREVEGIALATAWQIDGAITTAVEIERDGAFAERVPDFWREAFTTIERFRSAALITRRAVAAFEEREARNHLDSMRREVRNASYELSERARTGAGRAELLKILARRERAERELQQAVLGAVHLAGFSVDAVARTLKPGEGAVAYRFYAHTRPAARFGESPETRLIAFAIRSDGAFRVFHLASGTGETNQSGAERTAEHRLTAADLVDAVARWRELALLRASEKDVKDLGEVLRACLLDPILEWLESPASLRVVSDGALHLLPLDVLPYQEGLVGDRVAITLTPSLVHLVLPEQLLQHSPALTLVGNISFTAGEDRPSADRVAQKHSSGLVSDAQDSRDTGTRSVLDSYDGMLRGGPDRTLLFAPLSSLELDDIAHSFGQRFGREAPVHRLERDNASRSAVESTSAEATHLYVSTHAYFDEDPGQPSLADSYRALVPSLSVGIALSGANGAVERGDTQAWMTAEDAGSLDLRHCDLAVLATCESNVGVVYTGQGIHSLQAAFLSAGARSTVTSLWPVPDGLTAELMADFHRRLWTDANSSSKVRALWDARMKLRREYAPVFAWAGWVLSGSPD